MKQAVLACRKDSTECKDSPKKKKKKNPSLNHNSRMLQQPPWKSMRKKQEDESNKRMWRSSEKDIQRRGQREKEQREKELEVKGVKCKRLKRSFVQQFVDAIANLPQRESVLLSVSVQLGQELPVGKMVENVIDAAM